MQVLFTQTIPEFKTKLVPSNSDKNNQVIFIAVGLAAIFVTLIIITALLIYRYKTKIKDKLSMNINIETVIFSEL